MRCDVVGDKSQFNCDVKELLAKCESLLMKKRYFHLVRTPPINEQGEPAASYRRPSWVWGINGWSSRLQDNYHHFRGIYGIYLKLIKETERPQYVTGWTWKHWILIDYAQKSPWTLPLMSGFYLKYLPCPTLLDAWSRQAFFSVLKL